MPADHPAVPTARVQRDALDLLDAVVAASDGQERPGQREMCAAVADAFSFGRHLVAEAPTGTGKTFAVAAAAAAWLAAARREHHDGARIVIATATRALQDQLVEEDLPRVSAVADGLDLGFSWAVLKGRSNYLCLARAADQAGSLFEADVDLAAALVAEAEERGDGERSVLRVVDDDDWRRLSCPTGECPGAPKCSRGERCWAEVARRRTHQAELIVVNTALYAAHLLSGGNVLPDHDIVVVDEAHALADILVDAASVVISAPRLRALERTTREWSSAENAKALLHAADGLADVLDGIEDELDPTEGDLAVHLAEAQGAAKGIARAAGEAEGDDAARAATTAANLVGDIATLLGGDELDRVVWCEGDGRLRCSPVEAGEIGEGAFWPGRTVVCASATLRGADETGAPTFAPFLAGLGAPKTVTELAVPSPFDHPRQGMLYVPKGRIPSPKQPGWADGVADELWALASAAGGRTLALFTSRAATERAADELRRRSEEAGSGIDVLTQWDGPRDLLLGALRLRRKVIVCATRSFWTGIDIPGDACVVVAIDRLPFPRPDDPLMRARRERAEARGENAFVAVDLPAAATQLAQGAGRLIRSPDDRGVVAVLDTRLATAGWRRRILGALPPFKRTVSQDEVTAFLAES